MAQSFLHIYQLYRKKIQNPFSTNNENYRENVLIRLFRNELNACFFVNNNRHLPSRYGTLFVDRNPKYFQLILDFLRKVNTNEEKIDPENVEDLRGLLAEAKYYEIDAINDHFKYFGDTKEFKWKLLYRASVHGF